MLQSRTLTNPEERQRIEKELYRLLLKPISWVGLVSLITSLSWLVQPLYMMNLFDRVLSSNSTDTLLALTLITLYLVVIAALLEAIRHRILVRIGRQVDELLAERLFRALLKVSIGNRLSVANLSQVRTVRSFIGGQALVTFFDIPFVPIYLAVLWIMHPLLGGAAVFGLVSVTALTLTLQGTRRKSLINASNHERLADSFAENCLRNSEAIFAMGMESNVRKNWVSVRNRGVKDLTEISDFMSYLQGAMKGGLLIFSIFMMAIATWLVISGSITSGALFATNVLAMRALQPVQSVLGGWESYTKAREALRNIVSLLMTTSVDHEHPHKLSDPKGNIKAESFSAGPPDDNLILIRSINFNLPKGTAVAIVGQSGSGKSSLAKSLVGLWPAASGSLRLDSATFDQWSNSDLGPFIGYVPQDIEFFEGSVARNIARFGEPDSEKVMLAAKQAGIHDLILSLESGYDTVIQPRRGVLSMGQRQRLAIARAVYGDPILLVMDEPNSNLDGVGQKELKELILHRKSMGTTVVIVAHDRRLLSAMDFVLVMSKGRQLKFGAVDEVLQRFGLDIGLSDFSKGVNRDVDENKSTSDNSSKTPEAIQEATDAFSK